MRALTDFSASNPEILVRTKDAFSLLAVSSALRPCLANSAAPSATVANDWPVSLATLNMEFLNLLNVASVA